MMREKTNAVSWIVLLFALAGCGSESPSTADAKEAVADYQIVLSARFDPGDATPGSALQLAVRIRNQTALNAKRSGSSVEPIPLAADWAEAVQLHWNPPAGSTEDAVETPLERIPIDSTSSETTLATRPARATWMLSPAATSKLKPGTYTVDLTLDTDSLWPDAAVGMLTATARFELRRDDSPLARSLRFASVARFERRVGDCEKAISAAREAIALDATRHPAYLDLAECNARTGDTANAIAVYQALLEQLPEGHDFRTWIEGRIVELDS